VCTHRKQTHHFGLEVEEDVCGLRPNSSRLLVLAAAAAREKKEHQHENDDSKHRNHNAGNAPAVDGAFRGWGSA
jgi:hypothetical protein